MTLFHYNIRLIHAEEPPMQAGLFAGLSQTRDYKYLLFFLQGNKTQKDPLYVYYG